MLYNTRVQKQQLLGAAEDTMRAVITAVDYESFESMAALDALVASSRLASGDFAGFAAEATQLLYRRPEWANVVLATPSGEQLVNAALSSDAGLRDQPFEPDSLRQAVRERTSVVGNVVFNDLLGMYGFGVRVPVLEGSDVRYVLTAVMKPDAIQHLLASQAIPAGGVVSIFDRNNRVVARSRDHDKWLGERGSPGMLDLLETQERTAWGVTTTLEGLRVYSVFYRSASTGWSAAVGIPVATLDDPINRSYIVLGGSLLLSALLGLGASLAVARTITRPMRELEDVATRVRAGGEPEIPRARLPEIEKALSALAEAHGERERLLQSERQARLLEEEARHFAERASKEKDEFLAMLGHEFRNPLAAIASSIEVLAHAPQLSQSAVSEVSEIIRRQVKHLARMTEELLEASRAMAGNVRIERERVDLAAVAERAVETLWDLDKTARHEVVVDVEPAWVIGDAGRLEQVVVNLLNNAIKYTPDGGTVKLETLRHGGEAILRVADTGVGIDPELLPRVFDPFVQGARTLDRAEGGLGIGLALVRRLVELHGGSVEAISAGVGHGSEFVVRLPAAEAEGEPKTLVAAQHSATGPTVSRRIALVEDNADVRSSLRRLLEREGHGVSEAEDGEAGIEVICRERPDIAIVDIGLPKVDGYAVARAVREALGSEVCLVALTGYGADADVKAGTAAGFDEYLVKPVDPGVLSKLIERLGDARRD
jgi:signal transduction histidine kinase/ActR/RegA family two-component response regulator